MNQILEKIKNIFKNINEKVDKAEDKMDSSIAKNKNSALSKGINNFFEKEGVKKVLNVISWILFAIIAYLSVTFIGHPFTFILFVLLALIVMPSFNQFLRKKEIYIAFWKRFVLFILLTVIMLITAPIDENGNLNPGIEGVDFIKIGNSSTVLNNEDLKVVEYAVNYYYDNVLVSSERFEANLYDVITFYEDGSQNGKYELVTENNFPLEINSESLKDNIINIYYRTPKEETVSNDPNVTYTNENGETVNVETTTTTNPEADDVILDKKEEIEWSNQTFEASNYEEVKSMLNSKVDSGTKNVVYTVEYIYDGEVDDSLTDYFVVPIGSKVTECAMKDKDGYVYVETTNCPIELKDNSQVLKVKYDLASVEVSEETSPTETTPTE